jgi:hypothetical protein
MSLELGVLTPENAISVEQASAIWMEEEAGTPDQSGRLEAYAKEVYDAYSDDDWPFSGGPDVEGGCCVHMTIASDTWIAEAPKLVKRAHQRGLVVYEPQEDSLYRPGEPYVIES